MKCLECETNMCDKEHCMKLSNFETIVDEELFVESHEATANNNKMSKRARQPYKDRLNRYYELKNNEKS